MVLNKDIYLKYEIRHTQGEDFSVPFYIIVPTGTPVDNGILQVRDVPSKCADAVRDALSAQAQQHFTECTELYFKYEKNL